jgi:hypothetical protein
MKHRMPTSLPAPVLKETQRFKKILNPTGNGAKVTSAAAAPVHLFHCAIKPLIAHQAR